jgi:hypothetical protein
VAAPPQSFGSFGKLPHARFNFSKLRPVPPPASGEYAVENREGFPHMSEGLFSPNLCIGGSSPTQKLEIAERIIQTNNQAAFFLSRVVVVRENCRSLVSAAEK